MSETPTKQTGRPMFIGQFFRWLFRRQTQGRVLVVLAALATLVAAFYLEENWRGKRAWENCQRELEAKGVVLDWNAIIPPAVPDGQNFFKAPKMQEWFVGRGARELSKRLQGANQDLTTSVGTATNLVATSEVAEKYLAWSDQFEPDFDLIREALKRPYARMDGDYSQPYEIPIPNFVVTRALVQVLAQRTKCYLLLGQPEEALKEITLLDDSRKFLEGAPTGKPMTLVAAMVNVAVTGLYVETIARGLQARAWKEPQIAAIQEQLRGINLPPVVADAFRMEVAGSSHTFATTPAPKLADLFALVESTSSSASSSKTNSSPLWRHLKNPIYLFLKLAPRGWWYQNMANCAELQSRALDGFDLENDTISPKVFDELARNSSHFLEHKTPFAILSAYAVPNAAKATQTLAYNQTLANEAQVVCALERYRLAHGNYPEALDALMPQFIEKIPHDIIGGQPLHYRRTNDGKFLLYSVGWNEADDGGQVVLAKDGSVDRENGDWVWQYPMK